MSRNRATDPTKRLEALRIAEEHGAAEASRRTGIRSSTIRMWRTRDRQAANPPVAVDDVERLRRTAEAARDAVDAAIVRLREILPTAKSTRDVATAAAVLTDKAQQLETIVDALEQRKMRLESDSAQVVVAVLEVFFNAIGIEQGPPLKRVLAGLLRQAGAGDVLSPPEPAASEARAALRSQIGEELRPEVEQELRRDADWWATNRGLPAPGDEPAEPEAQTEGEPEPADEPPGVADAEVVEDRVPSQWMAAYHDNEPLARAAWERSKEQDARREQREREKGQGFQFMEQGRCFRSP